MRGVRWRFPLAFAVLLGLAPVVFHLLRPEVVEPPRPYLETPLPDTVMLQDMTWPEVSSALKAGYTTVIIPTGGTEQNGPHAILGKHNYIMAETMRRLAKALGKTLVVPVMAYVPEGPTRPRGGHMIYPGTLSLSEATFEAVLTDTARSLKAHGFTHILIIGDSGDSQAAQERVALDLDRQWREGGVRVWQIGAYYAANGQVEHLRAAGESESAIGHHAGIRDTSELIAVHPEGVRMDRRREDHFRPQGWTGVDGDPTRASADIGEALLGLKVQAALAQIRSLMAGGKS